MSRLRRTRWQDLAGPFAVVGVLVYVLARFQYDSLPPLRLLVPVPLGALAVVEYIASRRVRAAVRHDPEATPMTAIAIARCVALGKASSVVGAAVAGGSVGLLAVLVPDVRVVSAAAHDARVAGLLLLACALLVAAALLLERAGVDPGPRQPARPRAD